MNKKGLASLLTAVTLMAGMVTAVPASAEAETLIPDVDYTVAAYLSGGEFINSEGAKLDDVLNKDIKRDNGNVGFAAYLVLDISNVDVENITYTSGSSDNGGTSGLYVYYTNNDRITTTSPSNFTDEEKGGLQHNDQFDLGQNGPSYGNLAKAYELTKIEGIEGKSITDADISAAKDSDYLVLAFRGYPSTTLESLEIKGTKPADDNGLIYGTDYKCAAYFNKANLTTNNSSINLLDTYDRGYEAEGYAAYVALDISKIDADTLTYTAQGGSTSNKTVINVYYTDDEKIASQKPSEIASGENLAGNDANYTEFAKKYALTKLDRYTTSEDTSENNSVRTATLDISDSKGHKYLVLTFRGWKTTTLSALSITGTVKEEPPTPEKINAPATKVEVEGVAEADINYDAVGYYVENLGITKDTGALKWQITMNDDVKYEKNVGVGLSVEGDGEMTVSFGIVLTGSTDDEYKYGTSAIKDVYVTE